jgi:hypothetical protein
MSFNAVAPVIAAIPMQLAAAASDDTRAAASPKVDPRPPFRIGLGLA